MKFSKLFILIVGVVLLVLLSVVYFNRTTISDVLYFATKESVPQPLTVNEVRQEVRRQAAPATQAFPEAPATKEVVSAPKEAPRDLKELPELFSVLPDAINLAVPFTPQAPFANWELPYKEACEEASVLMVDYFYRGGALNPQIADKEILRIIDWQKIKFGFYEDTDAAHTAQILRDYFGHQNVRVEYDISVEDIKKELAQGRPVIVPAAGRLLPNPFFRQPGPLYHMLVIKGYKDGKFITNDPGTRRGADFLYSFESLYNAIHDWNSDNVSIGRKAMIVAE